MKLEEHGFCLSGPAAWNSLPYDLYDVTDTNAFKNGSSMYFLSVHFDDCGTTKPEVHNILHCR